MNPNATPPWKPVKWEPADVAAVQALQRGEATPDQQKRVLDYIISAVAGTYEMSYQPASERDTAFAEGKRFVGLQIVKTVNLNLALIRQAKSTQETGR